MADDLNKRGPQDRSKINLSERYEVQYWTRKLGVTRDALERAVKSVGSSAKAIQDYLRGHQG